MPPPENSLQIGKRVSICDCRNNARVTDGEIVKVTTSNGCTVVLLSTGYELRIE